MSFVVPAAFGLAALTLPVLLMYMLKSRRARTPVSSTMLWAQGPRSVSASKPWQRLRPSWLLILQLLAILLAVTALARPALPTKEALAEHTVMIFDTSASMKADDGGRPRLESAKRLALKAVDQLSGDQKMSVLDAGPRPRVLLSGSSDKRAIVQAISSLRATDGPTDAAGAFSLGASLETANVPTLLRFYSDGGVRPEDREDVPGSLVHVPVGSPGSNAAVQRIALTPKGGGWDAFIRLANTGTVRLDATLDLSAGGDRVASKIVRLDPQRATDLTLSLPKTTATDIVASLRNVRAASDTVGRIEPEDADALSADDRAIAVLERDRALRILLVTKGNVFVESLLRSIPGATVSVSATAAPTRGYAMAIYDRVKPPADPGVPSLAIAPPGGGLGAKVTGTLKAPVLSSLALREPILAQVDLSRVSIKQAQKIVAPAMRTLAGTGSDPLIAIGVPKGRRAAYIAFDLTESNLPVQVAYPVLMGNLFTWLTQADGGDRANLQAGDSLPLRVPGRATRFTVRRPDGSTVERGATRAIYDDTEQAGFYAVRYFAGADPISDERFALNVPPGESSLTVRPITSDIEKRGRAGRLSGLRTWGPGFLAVVLLILAIEWWLSFGRPTRRRNTPRSGMA